MLVCDYCEKNENEVKVMITGRTGAICNSCVLECVDVLTNKLDNNFKKELYNSYDKKYNDENFDSKTDGIFLTNK